MIQSLCLHRITSLPRNSNVYFQIKLKNMKEKSPKNPKVLVQINCFDERTRKKPYFYLIILFVCGRLASKTKYLLSHPNILKQHAAQITVNTIEVISLKKLLAPSLNKHTKHIFFCVFSSPLLHFKCLFIIPKL